MLVPSENPDSHEYVLQPKWNSLKEYKDSGQVESLDLKILRDAWDPVAKQIRKILRDAVEKLDFSAEQKLYYNASATHQEIIRGALNPPEDSEPEKHVFVFTRSIDGLPADKTADGFIDLLENEEPDEASKTKLDN